MADEGGKRVEERVEDRVERPDDLAHAETAAAATLTATGGRPTLAPGDSLTGRHLAHFVLEEELGRGGMGVVYRARDLSLDRPVAIKVLSSEVAASPDRRDRFYREARAQARIKHPNVGHIYFIGEQDQMVFFAMELIEGRSVADLLEESGRLTVPEALDICRQAARGLAEAQRWGVVHRDVKPGNLMIDQHRVVKVLDFGIAAEAEIEATGEAGEGGRAEQTTLAGTPLYAAPEQVRGDAIDFRADVYALGVTLHQLVAGEPPFVADTAADLVELHTKSLRPRFRRRHVGNRDLGLLDGLTDRMMAKRPEDRFDSYEDLIEAFDFVEPEASRPAGAAVRGLALLLDVVVALLALAGFSVLLDDVLASRLLWLLWLPYQVIGIGHFGATVGLRLLGLEVVVRGRRRGAGLRAATTRALLSWGPVVATLAASDIAEVAGWGRVDRALTIAAASIIGLDLLHVAWLSWRSRSGRSFWDRAAGTQVRYLRLAH